SRLKLLYKLSKLGISGNILNSISSFLDCSMQRVKIGYIFSPFRSICSGVPQGSVLGPLLFVIYINDIVYASDQDNILKLFADDVKSYMSGSSSDCKERFCISVNDILKWADTWQLPVAFKKSSWGVISYGKDTSVSIIDDEIIAFEDNVKLTRVD